MPNTKSAVRRVRRVKKQTQINRIRKSKYKNAVKQMETLIKNNDKGIIIIELNNRFNKLLLIINHQNFFLSCSKC